MKRLYDMKRLYGIWAVEAVIAGAFVLSSLAAAVSCTAGPAPKSPALEQKDAPKTYATVTKDVQVIAGPVRFYRKPGALYLEVPTQLLDQPLGFAAIRVTSAGDGAPRGRQIDTQLVSWQRRGDHLVLNKHNVRFRAVPESDTERALRDTFPGSPVFSAPLLPLRDAPSKLVVEASGLFGPDLAEIVPEAARFEVVKDGALLTQLKGFSDNVVARVTYRLRERKDKRSDSRAERRRSPLARFAVPKRLADRRFTSMVVDYHFYRLADDGFVGREADERIGAFLLPFKDYSRVDDRDSLFRYLAIRWDVRKADPQAQLSDPVRPIVFTMDRSIPKKWRPLVRQGALWWNAAFERIGIRNAVQVLDPPEDPNWDPADIRHSVIYWNYGDDLLFSGFAGPTLVDPRNGKVLSAAVHLNAEFFSFARNRYLVYAWWRAPGSRPAHSSMDWAGADGRGETWSTQRCDRSASLSSQLAFARLALQARGQARPNDEVMERFVRQAFLDLVAHEIGHALGFPHNWKASMVSSWKSVRTGEVDGATPERVMSASVMDYNPIYIGPSGAKQGDFTLTALGPYDHLAVEYVYKPLAGKAAEVAEKLDRIAARAEIQPGLAYDGGELNAIDPTSNSDDLGDDPLAFADQRLSILRKEVLPRLAELVLAEGRDYNLLRQALDAVVFSVAMDYIDISARHVGGQILLRRRANSQASPKAGPPPIRPVPAADQRRALDVLDRHVFADGAFSFPPGLLAALKADLLPDWNYPGRYASDYDVGARMEGLYGTALATLLDPRRLARVRDNERRAAGTDKAFQLPELFERLERSAFSGVASPHADRRALQRVLVDHLSALVLERHRHAPAEVAQLAADSLRSIRTRSQRHLQAVRARGYARAHWRDLAMRVDRVLGAQVVVPPSGSLPGTGQ
ncbi:MAG: zinc-dependent metalloprotease [Proteobacteria bacterium]|nr:zinc-dependent metalloprotease [Pseudomonadota bacterium]